MHNSWNILEFIILNKLINMVSTVEDILQKHFLFLKKM